MRDAHGITLTGGSLSRLASPISPTRPLTKLASVPQRHPLIGIDRNRGSTWRETTDRLGPKQVIGISEIRNGRASEGCSIAARIRTTEARLLRISLLPIAYLGPQLSVVSCDVDHRFRSMAISG